MSVLRAEWTKFRSVPGWVRGAVVAALMILLFPVTGLGGGPPEQTGPVPIGPDGGPVVDAYYFVHRPLTGDGRITVAVGFAGAGAGTGAGAGSSAASGAGSGAGGGAGSGAGTGAGTGVAAPWAKAGLIVSAGPALGARYAAVMITGGHGVRMQHDYVHDQAVPVEAPRWLRLTRAGDTITGEASADGTHWTPTGTVRLPGLPATVEAGLFVACPSRVDGIGTSVDAATADFGVPQLTGGWPEADWSGGQVGAGSATFGGYPRERPGAFTPTADGFTVTGAGDLAPATRNDIAVAASAADLLFGTFPALIVMVVVATLMITTEYRYGLIRTTLAAAPRRGRVLAAKAAVLAGVTFTASLAAAAVAVPLWLRVVRGLGIYVFPTPPGALLRAEAGTAAMLAVTAVLALAVGTILRRSATAVTAVVVATVLPHLLARTPFLPPAMADWLTTFTPAAALAVQQTLIRYPQIDTVYTPATGYFPLSPWAGLAVLCAYTAFALALAAFLLRRRDA